MTFDAKPKRAPPKGIGQRPAKKKPVDEEMKDEEEKKPAAPSRPPAKRPALSSDKPKTTTAASSKGPTAPVIHEEDLGSGMSKEDAIDKAIEFYGAGLTKKFEEAKWQTKQEGFKDI